MVRAKVLLRDRTGIQSTVGIMTSIDISDGFPGALMESKLPEKTLGVLRENPS